MISPYSFRRRDRILCCNFLVWLIFLIHCSLAAATGIFGFDQVTETARKLATEPFKPPPAVPDFLRQISYDEFRDVRFDTAESLWKDSGNFQVQFIHPGLYYTHSVTINTIDSRGVRKVAFSPKQFSYGKNKFADKIPPELGFAGFRIVYPLYKKNENNHVMVFAGASYFRAVARKQVFGLSGRGLAIDTALPTGEEFPTFREFWLERPTAQARAVKIFALLDSPSLTGAYEFVVRPGDRTAVDVKARLFERKRVKELGVAPLTSMFLYGEEKPRPNTDWRPEVHDSDGLMMASGAGEWIWRPLINPVRLQVSYFEFDNLRGFGLLQRDRSYSNYEDLETRHEMRPSAWITPLGTWPKGQIKLVEIPSQKETNDNIVAYWVPRSMPAVGQALDIAYRINFQSEEPLDAASGRVTATRVGVGDKDDLKRIILDFEGGKLKSLPDTAAVKAMITMGADAQLVQQSTVKNPITGGWRAAFQVKPPKDKPLQLRAFLRNENDTLTETWSYLLEP
ncbi:MAG TPA: glucan biosynthesis protein G [Candidatus Polarisedimenticolaceae bacterium]|nr:glucan biosynthesis protein G [Candidatus Polarisedimenticolaceae bacterium]